MAGSIDMRVVLIGLAAMAYALHNGPSGKTPAFSALFAPQMPMQACATPDNGDTADLITGSVGAVKPGQKCP